MWRLLRGRVATQGGWSNDTNSQAEQGKVVDREALGRSRGGFSTKIHLAADSRCRPITTLTTAGQRHDSIVFEMVLDQVHVPRPGRGRPRCRPDGVLADKAYSSRGNRAYLSRRRIRATIPEKADQIAARHRRGTGGRPPSFDPEAYKDRNVVERAINKLRATRAVATRYDKRDFVYRGTIDVASIRIWLRDPVLTHPRDTP
jgi:transposase